MWVALPVFILEHACAWWTRSPIMYCPECTRECPPSALFNQQWNWRKKKLNYRQKFWCKFKSHHASAGASKHGAQQIKQSCQNKYDFFLKKSFKQHTASHCSPLSTIYIQVKKIGKEFTPCQIYVHNPLYHHHHGKQGLACPWFRRWFAFSQNNLSTCWRPK